MIGVSRADISLRYRTFNDVSKKPNIDALSAGAIGGTLSRDQLTHLVLHLEERPKDVSFKEKMDIGKYIFKPILEKGSKYPEKMQEIAEEGVGLLKSIDTATKRAASGKLSGQEFQLLIVLLKEMPDSFTDSDKRNIRDSILQPILNGNYPQEAKITAAKYMCLCSNANPSVPPIISPPITAPNPLATKAAPMLTAAQPRAIVTAASPARPVTSPPLPKPAQVAPAREVPLPTNPVTLRIAVTPTTIRAERSSDNSRHQTAMQQAGELLESILDGYIDRFTPRCPACGFDVSETIAQLAPEVRPAKASPAPSEIDLTLLSSVLPGSRVGTTKHFLSKLADKIPIAAEILKRHVDKNGDIHLSREDGQQLTSALNEYFKNENADLDPLIVFADLPGIDSDVEMVVSVYFEFRKPVRK
ncbi:MAG: hypothetical protein WC624_03470 [Candidatus Margulisiibacteriota bacterium]